MNTFFVTATCPQLWTLLFHACQRPQFLVHSTRNCTGRFHTAWEPFHTSTWFHQCLWWNVYIYFSKWHERVQKMPHMMNNVLHFNIFQVVLSHSYGVHNSQADCYWHLNVCVFLSQEEINNSFFGPRNNVLKRHGTWLNFQYDSFHSFNL